MKKNKIIKEGDNFLFSVREFKMGPFYVVERTFKDTGKVTASFTGPELDMNYFEDTFTVSYRGDIFEADIDNAIKALETAKEIIKEYRNLKEAN